MVVNGEGYSAKNGLEGDKGPDGFVPPVSELREARTVEESMAAIRRIGTEGCGDKAALVQVTYERGRVSLIDPKDG